MAGTTEGVGGGHGGQGGLYTTGVSSYGSAILPTSIGSGGYGGEGGGRIALIADQIHLDGLISCNGFDGNGAGIYLC